jgi:hypothetical protein
LIIPNGCQRGRSFKSNGESRSIRVHRLLTS